MATAKCHFSKSEISTGKETTVPSIVTIFQQFEMKTSNVQPWLKTKEKKNKVQPLKFKGFTHFVHI